MLRMSEIPAGYYSVDIPLQLKSRGTGEQIPLSEATAFDFMPQLIGSRFQEVPELASGIHSDFVKSSYAPFMTAANAYMEHAELLLMRDDLMGAIEAYKTSLHNATSFVSMVSGLGSHAALSSAEVEKLDLDRQYGDLESRIAGAVWAGEVAFNPEAYAEFVRNVRRDRAEYNRLNLLYFGYGHKEDKTSGIEKHDPAVGREYLDLCVRMGSFGMATYVAKNLGSPDEAAYYKELEAQQTKSKNDSELKALIDKYMPRSYWG